MWDRDAPARVISAVICFPFECATWVQAITEFAWRMLLSRPTGLCLLANACAAAFDSVHQGQRNFTRRAQANLFARLS